MIRIIYTPKRVNISLYSLHSERGREGRRQKERQGETARDRGEERDRETERRIKYSQRRPKLAEMRRLSFLMRLT